MRKRILLIAVPLVVVAIAAGVAVASPSGTDQRGDRLDELHAERPIAASDSNADLNLTEAGFQQAAKNIVDYVRFVEFTRWIDSQIVGDYIASVAAAEAAQAAAPRYSSRSSGSVYSDSNPGDVLSCIRQRESGGNYGIYNSAGSGAAGAYQFMPGTWNSIASSSGRGDLVGVDPAQAAPADQDAMAQALYAQQGTAPWGGAC
jgi:hypothetical protein